MARPKAVVVKIRGRGIDVTGAATALVTGALTSFKANEHVGEATHEFDEDSNTHIITLTAKGYRGGAEGPRAAVTAATRHVNQLLDSGADPRGREMQEALAAVKLAREEAKAAAAAKPNEVAVPVEEAAS
ncbi:MAG: hypothetical protein ACREKE_00565 [bacterium]